MEDNNLPTYPSRKQAFSLLSTIYGEIKQVLLCQSGYQTPWAPNRLKEIIDTYEKAGIETVLMVNNLDFTPKQSPRETLDMDNPLLSEILAKGRDIEITAKLDLRRWSSDFETIAAKGWQLAQSQWAQDAFCVQEYDQHYNILLQPIYSKRITDQFISTELAIDSRLNLLLKPTDLQFEGGNILAGDDYAIIGLNTLGVNWIEELKADFRNPANKNHADLYIDEGFLREHLDSLKDRFKTELGVAEIIWPGFPAPRMDLFGRQKYLTFQPAYHLDLFMMLGGKTASGEEIIFLADPRAGKLIAENAIKEQITSGLSWQDIPLSEDLVQDYFDEIERYFNKYNEQTDITRKFKVIRLPLLIEDGVAYSFNNSLMEDHFGHKRIFLPNYFDRGTEGTVITRKMRVMNEKMEALQDNVTSILRENGFNKVIWTGSGYHLQNFASRTGALRCVTKVLRRNA